MPVETIRAWVRMAALTALAIIGPIAPATAQGNLSHLSAVDGDQLDRQRLAQILGRDSLGRILLRSTSTLTDTLRGSELFRWAILWPDVRVTANSSVPFSLNDGSLWSGRGWNESLRFGVRASVGPVWLIVAPELVHSENDSFQGPYPLGVQIIPADRSVFSSPWHTIPLSADLPIRFGSQSFTRFDPGQSALGVTRGPVSVGVATEALWWGPGIRNAIVMSDNAPGFPHFFLRTSRPIATAAGWFEGSWIVGGLSESPYFDNNPANDLRSLAGLAITWRLRWVPDLQVGFTRAVFAPATGWSDIPLRLFNVFGHVGEPDSRPLTDSTMIPGRDQISSLFARWVFPKDGLEVYGEWSRTELPTSVRDFLTAANHTLGYTLGFQWARQVSRLPGTLRVQAEATYLEQSPTFRDRPEGSYYTSRAVIQGYTQRGQVIGASIGPGSSSQWLALDYFPERWHVGVVAGRIRWEDDALYALANVVTQAHCYNDVSLFAGVRGGYSGSLGRAELSLMTGSRLDPFFGHYGFCHVPDPVGNTDVHNTTLELRLSPGR